MIFVDLDGVLADNITPFTHFTGLQRDEMTTENYWKCVNDFQSLFGNRWFRELPIMPDAFELLNFIKSNDLQYRILTATGHEYINVSHQKRQWCQEVLGVADEYVITSPNSEYKAAYASPAHILIDDSKRSVDSWRTYGGIAIMHEDAVSTIDTLVQILNLRR